MPKPVTIEDIENAAPELYAASVNLVATLTVEDLQHLPRERFSVIMRAMEDVVMAVRKAERRYPYDKKN